MKKVPATDLTKREMIKRGYVPYKTEHRNAFTRLLSDLFGFCDVLCLGDNEIVAVQTTSRANMSSRIKKITDHENVAAVRKAGIRILVQGWDKGPNGRYRLKEADLS